MELNLDDKYYQKYIEYKQKYLLLKQLKNNAELEGGFLSLWGNTKEKTEKTETTNLDGEYLVFTVGDITKEDYIFVVSENKTKSILIDTFKRKYQKDNSAYIINIKGKEITSNIITNELNSDITKKLSDLKTKLYITKTMNAEKCDTTHPTLNDVINKYNVYCAGVDTILKTKLSADSAEALDKKRLEIQAIFLNTKKSIFDSHLTLQTYINDLEKLPEIKKFKTKTNSDILQETTSFTATNSDVLIGKIRTMIGDNNINMIIKIDAVKRDGKTYNFAPIDSNSISRTEKYREIFAHMGESEKKTTTTTTASDDAPK
jgi:hypothetical protein